MSNPNRPPLALTSQRPEAGSAGVQPNGTGAASDPLKPADRKRLDHSLRKHFRQHIVPGISRHLDNLGSSTGSELWVEVRRLMDEARIVRERERILDVCGSEIERLLVEPLLVTGRLLDCSVSYRIGDQEYGDQPEIGGHLCIQPQCEVRSYRLDFVITYRW